LVFKLDGVCDVKLLMKHQGCDWSR